MNADRDSTFTDVMDGLVQASFIVIARLSEVAARHDLSLTQLRVLAILRDRQPKMAELAAYLGLERSSVSGLIDRAVRRGLVYRETSVEDARAVRISFTPEGERLATVLTDEIVELMTPMIGNLATGDRQRLSGLLDRILANDRLPTEPADSRSARR